MKKKLTIMLVMLAVVLSVGTLLSMDAAAASKKKKAKLPYRVAGSNITMKVKQNADIADALNQGLLAARDKATDKKPVTVTVPKGKYKLGKNVRIYSNTTLVLTGVTLTYSGKESKAMLMTGTNGSYMGVKDYNKSKKCKGYKGFKNITVKGGTFKSKKSNKSTIIRMFHAKNITLDGVSLVGGGCDHQMEVAAIDGLKVTNCTFRDFGQNAKKEDNMEALQLDVAANSSVFRGVYHDTSNMRNVEITGCTFKNVPRGVGTHTQLLGVYHENIKINDNKFINVGKEAIATVTYKNCEIRNNVIEDCGGGILIQYIKKGPSSIFTTVTDKKKDFDKQIEHDCATIIDSNTIKTKYNKNSDEHVGIKTFGMNLTSSVKGGDKVAIPKGDYYISGLTITNNNITISGKDGYGIHLYDTRDCEVSNNTISGCTQQSLFVDQGSQISNIASNKIKNFRRDAAIVLLKNSTVQTITGNELFSGKNSDSDKPIKGIMLSEDSVAGEITNNVITRANENSANYECGILVFNGAKVTGSVAGNTLADIDTYGISVSTGGKIAGDVTGNVITNTGRNSIFINGSSVGNITKNSITTSGESGIELTTLATSGSITENTITGVAENGIVLVSDSTSGDITSNVIDKPKNIGITLTSVGKSGNITGNKITEPAVSGIVLVKDSTSGDITGNVIDKPGNIGISLTSVGKSGNIAGNKITSPVTSGIVINKGSSCGNIAENELENCGERGIQVATKEDPSKVNGSITGNTINNVGVVNAELGSAIQVVENCTVKGDITKNVIKGKVPKNGIIIFKIIHDTEISDNTIEGCGEESMKLLMSDDKYTCNARNNKITGGNCGIKVSSGKAYLDGNTITGSEVGLWAADASVTTLGTNTLTNVVTPAMGAQIKDLVQ